MERWHPNGALRLASPPLGEHGPLGLNPGRAFFSGAAWRVNSQAFAYRWPSSSRTCNPPEGLSRYVNPRFLPARTRY